MRFSNTCRLAACIALLTSLAAPAQQTAFATMILGRIEAFSDASSRNDQTVMQSLLDDDVLFASGSGTVDHDPQRDKSDATSALLKTRTEAFLNAGLHHNLATMQSYLGDSLIFVNETGVVSDRHTFTTSTPAGPASSITLSDWTLHDSDNIAVASFVEHLSSNKTQDAERKFLTVETWVKTDKDWKLICSQTTPLFQDPTPIVLPANAWSEYVGAYNSGPDLTVAITHDGNTLAISINGAKAVAYTPEAHDVFYVPGSPAGSPRSRILFQRDKDGSISGYESSRGLKLTRGNATTTASPEGITSKVLPAADLIVEHVGDVAVSTFIHERVTNYYGQVLHIKYRSTETWIKRGREWKMLTLQSRELDGPFAPK